jgi:hypothetical protein
MPVNIELIRREIVLWEQAVSKHGLVQGYLESWKSALDRLDRALVWRG